MQNQNKVERIISSTIFAVSLLIGIITSITILFPALIIRIAGGYDDYSNINPIETGIWTYPWIAVNVVLFSGWYFHRQNRIPVRIKQSVKFLLNFEISPKIALLAIIVIIGLYVLFSVHEIFEVDIWEDYKGAKPIIESWTPADITKGFTHHVKLFLDYSSMKIFGNYKVIPFMASISLLILTYFITKEITTKRFAGLIALLLVIQSSVYLIYDTSLTYDNYWVLFYLLSLYMIYKLWPLSPISFVLSILSKPLTVVFLPVTFFVASNTTNKRKTKLFTIGSYVVIMILGFVISTGFGTNHILDRLDWHDFVMAISGISYQMRYDGLILVFLLPLIISLVKYARNGVNHAKSVLVMILGALASQPILASVTIDSSEPYRFMPLVVFFAIGVGVLLSKPKLGESA